MKKQMIISLSREYGSGGRAIAEKLAEIFDIAFYDREMLQQIAEENDLNYDEVRMLEEAPRKRRNTFRQEAVSEDNVTYMQFDFIQKKALSGESFIIVGRCGGYVLRDVPDLIKIFITGDEETRVARVAERDGVELEEARKLVAATDSQRRNYHNTYCDYKWGDSRHYDLIINSSKLGIEKTAKCLAAYIRERFSD